MDKILNPEEIDATAQGFRGGRAGAAGQHQQVVESWDIRQAGKIGSEQMRAINQLHEVFARNLSNAVGAYLSIAFDCDLVPVGAVAVLQLDLTVAFPVIDLLLGGEGKGGDLGREITGIEEQILESIMRIVCRELQTAWQAIALEFQFGQRQPVAQAQRLMVPEEKNLCLSLEVKMAETRGTLNMAVPAVVSNALLRKISADLRYHRPRSPVEARRRIEKRLLDASFRMELFAPDLTVSLQALADLTPGTLLAFPKSIAAPAVLVVDEMRLCPAMPVRVNSRRAARILSIEPIPTSSGEQ